MDLYLDRLPELESDFQKEAGFTSRLSENVENWPQELSSELYKQLPYLSDYEVNVNLAKVEEQRGFAFGYADVSNKTERPETEHTEAGLPHIRIPLIVVERGVKPFSVFLDGEKVLPLNEERVREILFNPGTFDLSVSQPRDPSLVEPLMPPQRSGIGMGGEYKTASAELKQEAAPISAEELPYQVTRFKRHPDLLRQAIQIEKEFLELDKHNQLPSPPKPPSEEEKARMKKRDDLNFRRRKLELDLAERVAGSSKTAGIRSAVKGVVNKGAEDAVKHVAKKFAPHAAAGVAGTGAVVGGAAYAGAKKGAKAKEKTAAMKGMSNHYEGSGGVWEVVDGWLAELEAHNRRPIPDTSDDLAVMDKEAMVKEAFNHISKPQWDAIYKSDAIQKLVAKNGTISHPEVTNKVYEMASKTFGFHPKIYSKTSEMKAVEQKSKDIAKGAQPKSGGSSKPKTASLLQAIAPTIREKDRDDFVEKVAADATLRAGFHRSGIAPVLVEVMDRTKFASVSEAMLALADRIEPTVMTLQKLPGGDFLVKSANTDAFSAPAAEGQVVPGEEAAEAIGQDQAMKMQPGQTATAVADPVEEPELFSANNKVVDEFGEWLVQDGMGNNILGWVFPQTLAWDGNFTPQPIALFSNGSAYALQDSIAGELVGKGTTMPSDSPRGDGVFYSSERGKAVCTAPITVGSAAMGPDGSQMFMGTDVFGQPVQIHLADGLSTPTRISDTEYALPKSWKFMRLNNQTQLAQDPAEMNKMASARAMKSEVTVFFNGSYHLDGGCGISKLASKFREDLDPVTAEFMLGVLGVEGPRAKMKLAEARKKGHVKLGGLKTITLLSERYAESTKTASALLSKIPDLRKDLVKEAAAMDDKATVDNILALNFINPENLGIFISYMPELEETAERLAEMLLSCYLGMEELPEGAIDRGMKNIEEVLSSLKALQHAEA